jgi:prolyl-tRNA synthetase
MDEVVPTMAALLDDVQDGLFRAAREFLDAGTADVSSIDEAVDAAQTGFARIPFELVDEAGEDQLAQSAVTIRCVQTADGGVPEDLDAPGLVAVAGRSY